MDELSIIYDELVSMIEAVASWIADLFVWLYNLLVSFALAVGSFFKTLWTGFFSTVVPKLVSVFRDLHTWLETHLGPIVSFLTKLRATLDRIFNTYVKPILNLIQSVRKVLEVLRLFGIKWAAQLDADLAKIQGAIAGVFLQIKGILNGFIDIVNAISDPLGLLRRPTLVLSVRRIANAMIRSCTGLPPGFFFPSAKAGALPGLGKLPANFSAKNLSMNPPASSYLAGDDGLGIFSGFVAGTVPDDSTVDDVDPLDYFDPGAYPPAPCSDSVACLTDFTNWCANNKIISGQS